MASSGGAVRAFSTRPSGRADPLLECHVHGPNPLLGRSLAGRLPRVAPDSIQLTTLTCLSMIRPGRRSPATVSNASNQPGAAGQPLPGRRRTRRRLVRGHGRAARRSPGPVRAQRAQPDVRADSARYHMFDGDGMLHGVTFGDGGVSLPEPVGPLRAASVPRSAHGGPIYPRARRRHGVPRPLPDRRRRPGEEPGQHPHHPPRRSPAGPVGGRAADRGDRLARHRRRVRLRREAQGGDDRAPAPRPPHRRDALLRLLAVRAVPPLPRGRRDRRAGPQRRASTCRRR